MIKLLVGLGNPGPEYEHTRHNAGFWWVDAAARRLGARLTAERAFFGLAGRATRPEGPVWLLEPQTYMNLSGKAVAALARFYKIAPQELLVVHDELDLPPGQMRLKLGGGHAGHNGLRDIHAQLGSPDYWRLRLGIGHPGVKAEVANYVLRKPPAAEREAIEQSIDASLAQLDLLIAGRMEQAMMKLHPKAGTPGRTAPGGLPAGEGPAPSPRPTPPAAPRAADGKPAG